MHDYSVLYRGTSYDNWNGEAFDRSAAHLFAEYIDPSKREATIREHRHSDGKIVDQWKAGDGI